jgi:hypothetical protein
MASFRSKLPSPPPTPQGRRRGEAERQSLAIQLAESVPAHQWQRVKADAEKFKEKAEAELAAMKGQLDAWKSVFPDIAPESVQPDRSAEVKAAYAAGDREGHARGVRDAAKKSAKRKYLHANECERGRTEWDTGAFVCSARGGCLCLEREEEAEALEAEILSLLPQPQEPTNG